MAEAVTLAINGPKPQVAYWATPTGRVCLPLIRQVVTQGEAAQWLGISRQVVHKACVDGRIDTDGTDVVVASLIEYGAR